MASDAWACGLCMQRNPPTSDHCVTCSRPRDWQPRGGVAAAAAAAPAPATAGGAREAEYHSSVGASPGRLAGVVTSAARQAHAEDTQHLALRMRASGDSATGLMAHASGDTATGIMAHHDASASTAVGCSELTRPNHLSATPGHHYIHPLSLLGATFQLILWAIVGLVAFVVALLRPFRLLRADEQLRVRHQTGISVTNGPGLKFVSPLASATVVKAEILGAFDYVRIKSTLDGSERTENGPRLLFLGAYEHIEGRGQGVCLNSEQYVRIYDRHTGETRIRRGPCVWMPGPREEGTVGTGVRLNSTGYIIVHNKLTGERRVDRGPCMWFPGPHDEWREGSSVWLSSTEYVVVQDTFSGERRVDRGPCAWFPGPHDEWERGTAISLTATQYITVVDKFRGSFRSILAGNFFIRCLV
eukprot:TRINITY_DN26377_c0_g1_i2.p1 TRINITY_DN26377_c0_g1~~TRINITY_DN26377_c0_g1_i2.p1  ORF type:complete len:443 (-),score=50.74 TRINITY_DN26377_c0_g1_i2:147-1391(-)